MQAKDIDHLIEILDEIIAIEQTANSPLGYFPALYRKVTIEVRDKIRDDYFDDGPRMEQLDVGFANRYLKAYYDYKAGKPTTASWAIAFEATEDFWPIVLQHLFLGMNAHISLDLGITASEISSGDKIDSLQDDFNKINEILASLVDDVQRELGKIWPFLRIIDWLAGRLDEAVADFSIDIARDAAWDVAKDLAVDQNPVSREEYIAKLDQKVSRFGGKLYKPGIILGLLAKIIRLMELGNVSERIEILK